MICPFCKTPARWSERLQHYWHSCLKGITLYTREGTVWTSNPFQWKRGENAATARLALVPDPAADPVVRYLDERRSTGYTPPPGA